MYSHDSKLPFVLNFNLRNKTFSRKNNILKLNHHFSKKKKISKRLLLNLFTHCRKLENVTCLETSRFKELTPLRENVNTKTVPKVKPCPNGPSQMFAECLQITEKVKCSLFCISACDIQSCDGYFCSTKIQARLYFSVTPSLRVRGLNLQASNFD